MSNANIASSKTTDLRATGSILIDEFNPAGDDAQADWAQKGVFISPTVVAARPADLTGFYVTVANNYGKLQLTDPDALVAPGATTQVIFNNAGVLDGSADFTFNDTTDVLTVDGTITDGAFSTTAGTVTGVVALTASGAIEGGTLTDGTATITAGAIADATTITASGAIEGGTVTDGTFSTTAGDVTGVAELTMGAQSTGTATLVAGTVTVNSSIVAAGDSIIVTQNTPGGTTGTHYTVANADITAGVSFVIEATDTAGALVNTDTSTVNWLIIH